MVSVISRVARLVLPGLVVLLAACGSSETDGVQLDVTVTIEEGAHVTYSFPAGTKYATVTSDRNGVVVVWPCDISPETRSYGFPCYLAQGDTLRVINPVNAVSGGPEVVHIVVIRK